MQHARLIATAFLGVVIASALAACASAPAQRPTAASTTPADTTGPSQVVTDDDIRRTGRTDLSSALRDLVPQAQVH